MSGRMVLGPVDSVNDFDEVNDFGTLRQHLESLIGGIGDNNSNYGTRPFVTKLKPGDGRGGLLVTKHCIARPKSRLLWLRIMPSDVHLCWNDANKGEQSQQKSESARSLRVSQIIGAEAGKQDYVDKNLGAIGKSNDNKLLSIQGQREVYYCKDGSVKGCCF